METMMKENHSLSIYETPAYQGFLQEVVSLVQKHRVLAIRQVQSAANELYWNIGELILAKQEQYNWGKSVVERLSIDLTENVGEGVSWSPRNLWFMRQLVSEYTILKQPVSELQKLKQLMMELGYGFCFIGNQYRLVLGGKEYFVDLMFYHRILKCLVAVELKVTEFEPEYVGKLDFYLQLIDEQLKQADDNPSIGILLVPGKDSLEVEYALRISSKPIGVAQYTLAKELPEHLTGKLPTTEDFKRIKE